MSFKRARQKTYILLRLFCFVRHPITSISINLRQKTRYALQHVCDFYIDFKFITKSHMETFQKKITEGNKIPQSKATLRIAATPIFSCIAAIPLFLNCQKQNHIRHQS